MMYELPPQVSGSSDILALRDYLVRLAKELERVGNTDAIVTSLVGKVSEKAKQQAVKAVQDQSQSLKALIVKNANEITAYADSINTDLHSHYVAISDYGNYYEDIETKVQQTARATVESYHYTESISALNSYMTELNGQIRRGLIEDPDTHEVNLGIAISENLRFTGQTQDVGGDTYYELEGGQTLGLYTSTGWQFWINGHKRGWFSSEDSMLHVANIIVENKLQAGADWEISVSGGFGLKYIGG